MSAVAISFSGRSCSVASTRSAIAFERRDADRPLFAGLQQAADQLLALEALARAVLLHHHVRDLVDPLVAGEALAAVEALAPAADDSPSLLSRESTTLSPRWPQNGHFIGSAVVLRLCLVAASSLHAAPRFSPSCATKTSPSSVTGTNENACSTMRGADRRVVRRAEERGHADPKRLVKAADRARRRHRDADDEQRHHEERTR